MKSFALVLCLFASATASAEVWVDITLASKHINSGTYQSPNGDQRYNELNPGIGLTIPRTANVSAMLGTYKNSYKRQSTYAGVNIHTDNDVINFGVMVGAITGYAKMDIMPMVVPNVSVKPNPYTKMIVGFIPASLVDSTSSSAITLQISVKLF